jgi:hypothetical protein
LAIYDDDDDDDDDDEDVHRSDDDNIRTKGGGRTFSIHRNTHAMHAIGKR